MKKASAHALTLAALAVVVVQVLALATRYFQPWLDADYLLPQRFAVDVWAGVYPLSGWTLSSSPYLFPDFAFSLLWHVVLGDAPLLPFYLVTSYGTLALLAGWSLHRANPAAPHAWLSGALLVNVLLAWQGAADHARWLWWLGTATFHGGAVLLGLAQFALWAGPTAVAPTRARATVATLLLFIGLASDTLLLTQFVAPLGLALLATAGAPRWRAPRVRAFLIAVLSAYGLVAILRGSLWLAGWWNFPRVVRHAPTPSAVAGAAQSLASDLTGPVATAVPGFIGLFLVCTGAALWLTLRPTVARAGVGEGETARQASWFAAAGLASTLLLPALAVYWQNPQHGRYLLPCLILPLWWLFTRLPLARLQTPFVAGLVTSLLLLLAWVRGPQIHPAAWAWPYPERVAALDRFLTAEGRERGLADFWNAHYLNTVARSDLRLNQLRPDGRVQFWGNNAFHHFEVDAATGALRVPRYTFIVTNGLDPAALRVKFGEPSRIAPVADYEVWLYDEAAAQRLSAQVDGEVRHFLGDRPGTARIAR
ncbi:hypothetical protein Verru16b_00072 [Lacunisphaera limnophila]|uniref:Glycosyltransferase RgtA/B/C/D-like domain-containing protein n=1 Tax=Lacunisphaera limnophila TaxID=1838286 RepID=A0A1D8AQY6_9BACT|nr:hypothetical protein [Lacunisphaera limnophila]AOS43034.1 hypothetical protein Verru16b_00072 [Lacunisphaera limnophila]